MNLTYRQIEDMLAELHGIASESRVALQGRVKHFQRNGWPGGTNTGKGKAASYDFGSAVKIALGFELLEIGLTPERAANLLRDNWFNVQTALTLTFTAHPKNEAERQPFEVFIYCDPKGLARLGDAADSADDPTDDTFFYSSSPQLARALLDEKSGMPRRLALVNLSSLMTDMAESLGFDFDDWRSHHQQWDYDQRLAESEEMVAREVEMLRVKKE